jgi:hypothetical protein
MQAGRPDHRSKRRPEDRRHAEAYLPARVAACVGLAGTDVAAVTFQTRVICAAAGIGMPAGKLPMRGLYRLTLASLFAAVDDAAMSADALTGGGPTS